MDASVIYRYNVNGEIDKEFGNKGKVHVISDSSYYPISAHVDPKGAIYLLANQNDSVRLFKFDADGHYDDHFGVKLFKKFSPYFCANFKFGHQILKRLIRAQTMDDIRNNLDSIFESNPETLSRPNLNLFL